MSYQGFCAKYGQDKVVSIAGVFPMAVTHVVAFMQNLSDIQTVVPVLITALGTLVGWRKAVQEHDIQDEILRTQGVKRKEGAAIVKKAQAKAYAIPVSLALAFNTLAWPAILESDFIKNLETDHVIKQIAPTKEQPALVLVQS